jgi:putative colanic acid biosysnthesis UDP-glucose lipid carrier transferase
MAVGYSRYLTAIYGFVDILLLNLSFALVSLMSNGWRMNPDITFFSQFIYINFFWLVIQVIFRINEFERTIPYERALSSIIQTVVVHFLLLAAFNYFLSEVLPSISWFFTKYLLFIILLFTWRSLMWILLGFVRRRGLNYRKVILLGGGELSQEIKKYFYSHPEVGYRMEGIFIDTPAPALNGDVKGTISESKKFALEKGIDEIYCSLSDLNPEQVTDMMKFADDNLIRFRLIPDFRGFNHKKVNIDFYQSIPVISVRKEPLQSPLNRLLKRSFDFIFSLAVIVLIFPWLFPIIILLIKLSSKGPVFFKQKRSGKDNKTFTCYKFRTMVVNPDADELQASGNDARITGVGRFLRQTSLDELPQFFNVIWGSMSVVGPRPHMLRHTEEYSKLIDKFMVRHFIKPGITGWAQVNGLRGETRQPDAMQRRVEHDVWYIENWSMLLDLKIILITIKNVLSGEPNAV